MQIYKSTNLQINLKSLAYLITKFLFGQALLIWLFGYSSDVRAQEFSLSVSPPLTQILIKPGTKVTQTYQIASSGSDSLYSIQIFPFLPDGNDGQIAINENADTAWFTLLQPQVNFGEKFNIPAGSTTTVVIQINVPPDAVQKDYYHSLIFQSESEKGIGQSFSQTLGRIGSNLLISVSNDEDPFKLSEIQDFSAPLIIDSLGQIEYSVILKNVGRTLFKPIGRITVENFLSKKVAGLEIAPQNVLAYSERRILCLKEEELVDCRLDSPVLLGLYKAKLQFTLDGQDKVYQAETSTLALPFSPIAAILVVFIIFKIIKAKTSLDNRSE